MSTALKLFLGFCFLLIFGQNCTEGFSIQNVTRSLSGSLSGGQSGPTSVNSTSAQPINAAQVFFPQLFNDYCNYQLTSSMSPSPATLKSPLQPEIWYFQHSYLSAGNTAKIISDYEPLMLSAKQMGYTGVVLWDSFVDGADISNANFNANLKAIVDYGASIGLKVIPPVGPVGWASDFIMENPNFSEGFSVLGSQYKVIGSGSNLSLQLMNSAVPISNSSFSNGMTGWSGDQGQGAGAGVSADMGTYHSGPASAVFQNTSYGDSRLSQILQVTPHRKYHIGFWYKTSGLGTNIPEFNLVDASNSSPNFNISRLSTNFPNFNVGADTDWTQIDFTFNSQTSNQVFLDMGIWGWSGFAGGKMWVDDFVFEEVGPINIVRRPLAPLRISSGNTIYVEGTSADYNPVSDPLLGSSNIDGAFANDFYHAVPMITLPTTTRMQSGEIVSVSYYSAEPSSPTDKTSANLAEPSTYDFIAQSARLQAQAGAGQSGFFMEQDEMRQFQTTSFCGQTLGGAQLLGWNLQNTMSAVQLGSALNNPSFFVWNDMFDPYHNAHSNYYQVDADITNSWNYLPANVTVMNWNLNTEVLSATACVDPSRSDSGCPMGNGLPRATASLRFFAGMDPQFPSVSHNQLIAGYYDSGNGANSAQTEINSAMGVPGLQGFMYTSFNDDYTQMQNYAQGIKSQWSNYLSSLSANQVGR